LRQQSKRNIALTGFMAVGKTAVGRTLARKLKRRFIDLDKVIEKAEGMKVREIFAQKGEPYFRQLEKKCLAEVLQEESQVIATGGGAVMDDENLKLLLEKSHLVCLTASPQVILKRLGNGAKRPVLKGVHRQEQLEELLQQREINYRQARAFVDTSDLSVGEVVGKIVSLLKLEK
jgi:shikimate kinase